MKLGGGTSARERFPRRVAARAALVLAAFSILGGTARATNYKQPGFSETAVFTGLTNPTVVRFLPDGRVLVAEKSGLIKLFPNIATNAYTVVADLRTEVHNFWDRGLLGMVPDPNFATNNYIYVLYSYDAPIGGTPPKWGIAGQTSDGCPTPPGPTTDGCVVGGRLSRLEASGNTMVNPEHVLIEAWCQQFPSHSVDGVVFGTRALVPEIERRGGGAIVATSSMAGLIAFPGDAAYTATKHAVVGWVRSLGPALRDKNITINTICPGLVDTPLIDGAIRDALASSGFPLISPEDVAEAVYGCVTGTATGKAVVVQLGVEPTPFRFGRVPGPRAEGAEGKIPPEWLADRGEPAAT